MNKPIRWGIMGGGKISAVFASDLAEVECDAMISLPQKKSFFWGNRI